MALWRKVRTDIIVCAVLLCSGDLARAQLTETNGMVRVEAELPAATNRISRTINSVTYSWADDTATPGFSGTGYIEALPSDGTSTNTVTTNWEATNPQINYSITFSKHRVHRYRNWSERLHQHCNSCCYSKRCSNCDNYSGYCNDFLSRW